MDRGVLTPFRTFAPLALASINARFAPALMSRSIKIRMQKSATDYPKVLDAPQEVQNEFILLADQISRWAYYEGPKLDQNPVVPGYVGRAADPFRVLFAIAANVGKSAEMRRAAKVLLPLREGEHPAATLVRDIKTVYAESGKPALWKTSIFEALRELGDGHWSEYRGLYNDMSPHKLTLHELNDLLRGFDMSKGNNIREPGRPKTARGWYATDFEKVWAAYCPDDTTTPTLRVVQGDKQ